MTFKTMLAKVFVSVVILSGCAVSTPTSSDQTEEDLETQVANAPDRWFDIVLLYNSSPEKRGYHGGGDREPIFRKNIDGDLQFNEKFSSSEVLASHCEISQQNKKPYRLKLVHRATKAINRLTQRSISSMGIDLPIKKEPCKNLDYLELDLVTIPRYTYDTLVEEDSQKLEIFRPVTVFPLNALKRLSDKVKQEESQYARSKTDLSNRYAELENYEGPNFSIGSILMKINVSDGRHEGDDYFYPQNICALEKGTSVPRPIVGYRAFGREILNDEMKRDYETWERQNQDELRITGDGSKLSFYKTFGTLNEAYLYFSNLVYQHRWGADSDWEENCAIFVAPASDIGKLRSALSKDGIASAYGKLFSVTESNQRAATQQGFRSHDEFKFVTEEKLITKWDQLEILRQYDANSPGKFDRLQEEIRLSEYTNDKLSIDVILNYLKDRQAAIENSTDVLKEKQERVARQAAQKKKQEQIAARRQAVMEENFPYVATLSCEFQGNHTNIAACFLGGEYSASTQLELTNDNSSRIYQGYELNTVGRELRSGLSIDLTKSFSMQVQNASEDLSLRLKIVERKSGEVVFEDIASQYGVIGVQN